MDIFWRRVHRSVLSLTCWWNVCLRLSHHLPSNLVCVYSFHWNPFHQSMDTHLNHLTSFCIYFYSQVCWLILEQNRFLCCCIGGFGLTCFWRSSFLCYFVVMWFNSCLKNGGRTAFRRHRIQICSDSGNMCCQWQLTDRLSTSLLLKNAFTQVLLRDNQRTRTCSQVQT